MTTLFLMFWHALWITAIVALFMAGLWPVGLLLAVIYLFG